MFMLKILMYTLNNLMFTLKTSPPARLDGQDSDRSFKRNQHTADSAVSVGTVDMIHPLARECWGKIDYSFSNLTSEKYPVSLMSAS